MIIFTFITSSAFIICIICFIYFKSSYVHHRVHVYYELTMTCSPIGLIRQMDRALRPVVGRSGSDSRTSLNFFRFFFNQLGRSFYCDHSLCTATSSFKTKSGKETSVSRRVEPIVDIKAGNNCVRAVQESCWSG